MFLYVTIYVCFSLLLLELPELAFAVKVNARTNPVMISIAHICLSLVMVIPPLSNGIYSEQ